MPNPRLTIRYPLGVKSNSSVVPLLASLTAGLCVLLSCCTSEDDVTVWKASFPSSDGSYIATARTLQNGGFGSNSIQTEVLLAQVGRTAHPIEVVGFGCDGPMPRPYTLDNVANAGGSIDLHIEWITPNHLHVTYRNHPEIYFQAIKFNNIVITLDSLDTKGVDSNSAQIPR
jgi:hypothetical protein